MSEMERSPQLPTVTLPGKIHMASAVATRGKTAVHAARPKCRCVLHTEANARFLARPVEERKRVIDRFLHAMARAYAGTTLEEYLAERRREAERDA